MERVTVKKIALYLIFALALLSSLAFVAFAVPPNEWHLTEGYDLTTDYQGIDVPIGNEVTAYAATTDPTVYSVTFNWKDPADQVIYPDAVTDHVQITYEGQTVYVFESKFTPEYVGHGSVQAHFQGEDGKTLHDIEDVVAIKAASFNVIPELPVIGTAGASIAMMLGLAYQLKRRIKKPSGT
jgi:hypothetical protein